MVDYVIGARHSTALVLGDDMCVRTVGCVCRLWRPGQRLLHLQPEDEGGKCARLQRAARTHGVSRYADYF